jgi:hypothetical protein
MMYRDDDEALRSYHGHLVAELARLEAKAGELAGVEADRARIAAELARVRRDLEQQRARRSPIRLDNLRVASPCKESWDKMTGDDRVRDCARCEKPVYNLSNMTAADAQDLLATRGVTACVRFYRRADGTVMTSDCPVGAKSQRRSIAIAAGMFATAAAAGGIMTAMDSGPPASIKTVVPQWDDREPLMGAIEAHPPIVEPVPEEVGKIAPPPHEAIMGGVGPGFPEPPQKSSPEKSPEKPHKKSHKAPRRTK